MSQGIWMNDTVDSDAIVSVCLSAMPNLIKELRDHRLAEGARLTLLLRDRCTRVQLIVAQYREQLPLLQAAQEKKLRERIHAFDVDCDEQRLEEELVFLANKSDVAEELDRLDAHVAAIGDALSGNEPCGRRLDFLMQELNREANTLGSKTTSLTTSNAFLAVQPILISIKLAPRSAQIFAASAITGGSQPASWIDSGASAIASVRNFRISLFTSRRTAALAIISVTTKPPPQRRTARRNGQSVTPDIGAKMAAWGKMFPSIARDIKDPETDPKRQAPIMNIGKTPT